MSIMTIVAVAASILSLAVGGATLIGDGYQFDLRNARGRRANRRAGGRRAVDSRA